MWHDVMHVGEDSPVREREEGLRRHPRFLVLAERERRLWSSRVEACRELAEQDDEAVHDLIDMVEGGNLCREQQPVQHVPYDSGIFGVVQHDRDGGHRGPPHQPKHLLVEACRACEQRT